MTDEIYRGVVHAGTVVLLEHETPLGEGTEVLVTPVTNKPGTSAAVLAAVENSAPVPIEWVDELEQLILSGQRAPIRHDLFSELRSNEES